MADLFVHSFTCLTEKSGKVFGFYGRENGVQQPYDLTLYMFVRRSDGKEFGFVRVIDLDDFLPLEAIREEAEDFAWCAKRWNPGDPPPKDFVSVAEVT